MLTTRALPVEGPASRPGAAAVSLEQMMALAAQVERQPRRPGGWVSTARAPLRSPAWLTAEEWAWLFPAWPVSPAADDGTERPAPRR